MATWSYSGDPSASSRDAVRYYIGDTDSTLQQLTNAEIDFQLTEDGSSLAAAVNCCYAIQARYARLVSSADDKVKKELQQKASAYEKLALNLRSRLVRKTATITAGGLSVAEKLTTREDTDLVQPTFTRDMMENPTLAPEDEDWRHGR